MKNLAAILVLTLAAGAGQARAETLKIAIPQKGNWDTEVIDYAAKSRPIFKNAGLDLDLTYTQGGATTEQAVISGSVDMAMGTGTLGIVSAFVKGAPVRIISAEMTGVPDIFWYARPESGIKSMKDAAGKTVAFSAPGSSSNLVLLTLLQDSGVTTAKTVATGGIPGTLTQVMSGQIDIGWGAPPTPLKDVTEGHIAIIAHGNDAPQVRDETVRVNAVNGNFLQQHRDAIIRFAKAYQQAIDWAYSDPKAIDLYAVDNAVPHETAERALKDFYPKSAMQPYEIRGLQRVLDEALEARRIAKPMKPDELKGLVDIVWQPGK